MTEQLAEQIRQLAVEHKQFAVARQFARRLKEGGLTRDENSRSHFCVYFAAFDPAAQQLFIGHHKKSDKWLFNGGHIDLSETIEETVHREIGEEWGRHLSLVDTGTPQLLTITEIYNPARQSCKTHYDIWFFVPVDRDTFAPDEALLASEYHTMTWLTLVEARRSVTDPNTLTAVDLIEESFAR